MRITIEVFMGEELVQGARKALSNRLFQSGWILGRDYHDIIYKYRAGLYPSGDLILIANDPSGKPIASAFSCHGHFQVFVRKMYRRQGIGSALYSMAMKTLQRKKSLEMGIEEDGDPGAFSFYQKNRKKFENQEYIIVADDSTPVEREIVLDTVLMK